MTRGCESQGAECALSADGHVLFDRTILFSRLDAFGIALFETLCLFFFTLSDLFFRETLPIRIDALCLVLSSRDETGNDVCDPACDGALEIDAKEVGVLSCAYVQKRQRRSIDDVPDAQDHANPKGEHEADSRGLDDAMHQEDGAQAHDHRA